MPCWIVFFVEFFFNVGGDVFFNVVFLERLGGTVNGVLLHVFGHVSVLDYGFAIRHLFFDLTFRAWVNEVFEI